MGEIREWSSIFELMEARLNFRAVFYGDEKKEDITPKSMGIGSAFNKNLAGGRHGYGKKSNSSDFFERYGGLYEGSFFESLEKNFKSIEKAERLFESIEQVTKLSEAIEKNYEDTKRHALGAEAMMYEEKGYMLPYNLTDKVPISLEGFMHEEGEAYDAGYIKKSKKEVERVLGSVMKGSMQKSMENVKIEVTNNNTIEKDFDIDHVTQLFTDRLCEMMARGADGLY